MRVCVNQIKINIPTEQKRIFMKKMTLAKNKINFTSYTLNLALVFLEHIRRARHTRGDDIPLQNLDCPIPIHREHIHNPTTLANK